MRRNYGSGNVVQLSGMFIWNFVKVDRFAWCFAGPFVRFGGYKAVVAFLVIFAITALFSVARWAEHCRYQSTLSSKEPTEKVPS